jgi:hypothetical protein
MRALTDSLRCRSRSTTAQIGVIPKPIGVIPQVESAALLRRGSDCGVSASTAFTKALIADQGEPAA